MTKKNPIEKRIDKLTDQWNAFAQNEDARVLRWCCADDDERRMIEAFIKLEDSDGGSTPDLFIPFDVSFESKADYGARLARALIDLYAASQEELGNDHIKNQWSPPARQQEQNRTNYFFQCCLSFQEYHAEMLECLVLVLVPGDYSDIADFQRWILEFLSLNLPPTIRIILVENKNKELYGQLSHVGKELVETVDADLNMADAITEVARNVPGNAPGNRFRRFLVGMNTAAAKGNLRAALKSGRKALQIAEQQQWPHMQCVVYMGLGSLFLGQKDITKAVQSYQRSYHVALAAEETGDEVAPKLVLQSQLATASAFLAEANYKQAVGFYLQSAPLAKKVKDPFMIVESLRMAAYCYEQLTEYEDAWKCGNKALEFGERIPENERENTTLPFVAQGLERVAEKLRDTRLNHHVEKRMHELALQQWRETVEGVA
ncbi:MAG: hypothetical protein OEZ43_15815 [Gammaproteobacteria bacterium]|nr:hypothetical protein [Gammaproteobacteria bacterium]